MADPIYPKVIQIIPANGWFSYYKEDDGQQNKSRIVCIALYDDGDIQFMDTDSTGYIDKVYGTSNLSNVKHESEE